MEYNQHLGGDCPVGTQEIVEVVMLDGDVDCAPAGEFVWRYDDLGSFFPGYIVRYRRTSEQAHEVDLEQVAP